MRVTNDSAHTRAPLQTIKLQLPAFSTVAKLHGWDSPEAIADALGMSPRQVRRVLDGSNDPGVAFIGGLLVAAPELGFRRVFVPVNAALTEGEEVI